jgi:hypothetical protein
MYLLYSQYYDDITFIGISDSEEEAKEYAEYFSCQYEEVESVQSKRYWPKKINVYMSYALISENNVKKYTNSHIVFENELPNEYSNEGIRIGSNNIYAVSHNSQEEADKMFEEIYKKYKIKHRPNQYGQIVSEFVLC